jgi:acyl carrier protein
MATIKERVRKIIVDQLDINEEQVTDGASFLDDLGADSSDTVELVMVFEDEFKDELKGEIPEAEAEKMRTVRDVIFSIKSKIDGYVIAGGCDAR